MASITCGKCGNTHASTAEVKACFAGTTTVTTTATVDIRMAQSAVPASKYALENLPGHANKITFFEVKTGRKGTKWEGFQFLTRLVGHPGSFQEFPVKGDARKIILRKIADGPRDAALRFSREFSVCAACGSPLTDDESRARGFGPVCAEKF